MIKLCTYIGQNLNAYSHWLRPKLYNQRVASLSRRCFEMCRLVTDADFGGSEAELRMAKRTQWGAFSLQDQTAYCHPCSFSFCINARSSWVESPSSISPPLPMSKLMACVRVTCPYSLHQPNSSAALDKSCCLWSKYLASLCISVSRPCLFHMPYVQKFPHGPIKIPWSASSSVLPVLFWQIPLTCRLPLIPIHS